MTTTRFFWLAFFILSCISSVGQAQTWPSKPVRVIVPVSAGSGIDIVGRAASQRLAKELGQPLVIENRAGAGTTIGAAVVASAAPDGYTLLFASPALTTTPSTIAKLSYDVARDFVAVAPFTNTPLILVTPRGKYKTVGDMVAAAKAGKNPISYGINGHGSASHFATERFRLGAGFQGQPVAYRGTPEALTEVMTDRLGFYFSPLTATQSLITEGRVDALATTSRNRPSKLPNVPTFAEAGYPNADFDFWVGLFAPAKTPRDIVERLYREARKISASAEFRNAMSGIGGEPMEPMTIEQFNAYIRAELARNAGIAKAAGLVPQ
ncbi:MAG: tripartite tricarboxylate transporter substrate binding protein [Betaproteobacteria bacterium]|nr:tripartite tricarboxylate transporter substrate binding protein [Betaproteobacteria bacterium]